MAILLPLTSCICLGEIFLRSISLKTIFPETIFPGASTSPIIEKPVIVFPEPDSPTRPTISPALIWKLISSTAFTIPSFLKK